MNYQHVYLLNKKNLLLKWRMKIWLIFEMLIPIVVAVYMALALERDVVRKKPTVFKARPYEDPVMTSLRNETIAYVPKTPSIDLLIRCMVSLDKTFQSDLSQSTLGEPVVEETSNITFIGFETEQDAVDFALEVINRSLSVILVFGGQDGQQLGTPLPKKLTLLIRPTLNIKNFDEALYPKKSFFTDLGCTAPDNRAIDTHRYIYAVYQAITRYWMLTTGRKSPKYKWDISTKCFSLPSLIAPAQRDMGIIFPICSVLALVLFAPRHTTAIMREKEDKLTEILLMMGVTPNTYWFSWFVCGQWFLVPMIAIMTFIINFSPVFSNGDTSVYFVFMCIYGCTYTTYCLLISTLVKTDKIASLLALVGWSISTYIYKSFSENYQEWSKLNKLATSLGFNTACLLGLRSIASKTKMEDIGMKWSNIYKPAEGDDISLLECTLMLLLDFCLYTILAWYIDQVKGGTGTPKPLLFFTKSDYWYPKEEEVHHIDEDVQRQHDSRFFEAEPTTLKRGIEIRNLRKKYGEKVVVNGTTLNLYEDQVTVLLGHNGAGKTVTIGMLTGLIKPTSGSATINGYDIHKNLDRARHDLGVCPQFNILYDNLTVMEHLVFYSSLKSGMTPNIERNCFGLADLVGLRFKLHQLTKKLSGGQKRMLSVAISLVGGSKIIILDEPTAGMDVAIRRQTWDVLKKAKAGRTVLLTTHYMDEADILGDRIAIMLDKDVKCCGSSLFLKQLYGSGYHLVMSTFRQCDPDELLGLVQSFVPNAKLEGVVMNEITFELPHSAAHKFAKLFESLDEAMERLGIQSYGIGTTSLEEVFLRVAKGPKQEEGDESTPNDYPSYHASHESIRDIGGVNVVSSKLFGDVDVMSSQNFGDVDDMSRLSTIQGVNSKEQSSNNNATVNEIHSPAVGQDNLITGCCYVLYALSALLVKKCISCWRDKLLLVLTICSPVVIGLLVLPVGKYSNPLTNITVPLDVSDFGEVYIPYGAQYGLAKSEKLVDVYADQLHGLSYVTLHNQNFKSEILFDEHVLKKMDEFGLKTALDKMPMGLLVYNSTRQKKNTKTLKVVAYNSHRLTYSGVTSMRYALNAMMKDTLENSTVDIKVTLHFIIRLEKGIRDFFELGTVELESFNVGFDMLFPVSLFVMYPMYIAIQEVKQGTKHLQLMTGIGPMLYWSSNIFFDFIFYFISLLLLLIAFYVVDEDVWMGPDGQLHIMLLLLAIYGWTIHGCVYALSFFVDRMATGVKILLFVNNFLGTWNYFSTMLANTIIKGVMRKDINFLQPSVLSPGYNLMLSTATINTNYKNKKFCENANCSFETYIPCCPEKCNKTVCLQYTDSVLDWGYPGIGILVLALILQGVVSFFLVFTLDYHVWDTVMPIVEKECSNRVAYQTEPDVDEDVAAERHRIEEKSIKELKEKGPGTDHMTLANVLKLYGGKIAVNRICVAIPKGECFGLLGQNGAGKTTTFKMMSGDLRFSSGRGYIMGYDITSDRRQAQAKIGYCPQFGGIFPILTPRETLTLFAKLRGIPSASIPSLIEQLSIVLMFTDAIDVRAGLCSGGTKRKLNVAITLTGRPPVLFLDEPSWGMDPESRRNMWDTLGSYRNQGTTLILTSHNMEEAEALCTRMAIMVNGSFRCLGSSQHLKSKFGNGYTIIVQLSPSADGSPSLCQPVIDFVTQNLIGSVVFDQHQRYIHFQAPRSCSLCEIFKLLETVKGRMNIRDYSVQQTSLEEVFLSFARTQIEPKNLPSCKIS